MRRPASALFAALCLTGLVPASASAAPAVRPGSFVVPRPVPPSIGISFGYGYRHPEKYPSSCDPRSSGVPKTIKLDIAQLPGAARLTFWSTDDPDIKRFKVTAVGRTMRAGRNPLPVWRTVAVPKGCRNIVTTVTGLKKGEWYDVWVDAVIVRRIGAPGTLTRTVGRTGAFQSR